MLHFPLEKFYPLAILFEDAIILGAENDTILFNASSISSTPIAISIHIQNKVKILQMHLRAIISINSIC